MAEGEPITLPTIDVPDYGHGGTADAWNPHGAQDPYYGFVIMGGHNNQDSVSGSGNPSGAAASHYYSGYWSGVQGALYGLQPQANPFLSFGLTPPVGLFPYDGFERNFFDTVLPQPSTSRSRARASATAKSLDTVSHSFGLWLVPDTATSDWYLGSGINGEFPLDLPDLGDPTGPPMHGFSPISGSLKDFSRNFHRVNPELNYLEQDPGNFVIDSIERLMFDRIRPMTNEDAKRIGHIDGMPSIDLGSPSMPDNIPSGFFPGNINSMSGLASDFGGPTSHFGDEVIDSSGFFPDQ